MWSTEHNQQVSQVGSTVTPRGSFPCENPPEALGKKTSQGIPWALAERYLDLDWQLLPESCQQESHNTQSLDYPAELFFFGFSPRHVTYFAAHKTWTNNRKYFLFSVVLLLKLKFLHYHGEWAYKIITDKRSQLGGWRTFGTRGMKVSCSLFWSSHCKTCDKTCGCSCHIPLIRLEFPDVRVTVQYFLTEWVFFRRTCMAASGDRLKLRVLSSDLDSYCSHSPTYSKSEFSS